MLGRKSVIVDHTVLRAAFREGNERISRAAARQIIAKDGGYSEPLCHHLGASAVDSLDASDYERSTSAHDLNQPLPEGSLRDGREHPRRAGDTTITSSESGT